MCAWIPGTVILPCGDGTGSSLHPMCFSAAPHSEVWTCAVSAQITAWCDRTMLWRQSTFAAVPLNTRNTCASPPSSSLILATASRV